MAQKNDQVFQLSLTEIAFTIAFLMLLLLGYVISKEQSDRLAAEVELAKVQSVQRAEAALEIAKTTLASTLKGAGSSNPDDVISKLLAVEEVHAERDQLKKQVEDLDAKLTTLAELQRQLESAAQSSRPEITKNEIDSALSLQEQVRKAIEQQKSDEAQLNNPELELSKPKTESPDPMVGTNAAKPQPPTDASTKPLQKLSNNVAIDSVKQALVTTAELKKQMKRQLDTRLNIGNESRIVQELVTAAKNYRDLAKNGLSPDVIKKENSDLRGQVAFLKNKLEARGGRDYPPCWADENGKVEFLFSVEMKPDSVAVTPAWPERREKSARDLPGISEALAGPLSNQHFISSIQGIFNWSKKQDPECRHYVQLKSAISDAVQSDRARLMVENYFYKTEVRR